MTGAGADRSLQESVDPLASIDTRSPDAVASIFEQASLANRDASCRRGAADHISPSGALLATGDLHDNPLHLARILQLAALETSTDQTPRHVTLHEVIHSERLVYGVDLSHRALLRVAALKIEHPEHVHTLLANHELAQIIGAGVIKNGVRMVEAFNDGVDFVFGDDAELVHCAVERFIRSMPLALICQSDKGHGMMCAHSLPSPAMMDRFNPGVLERELCDEDYEPRRGSAHLMVWGRRHQPEQLERLAAMWGVSLFLLGHEHADNGIRYLAPNTLILNSDHDKGVALRVELGEKSFDASTLAWCSIPLSTTA